jgi:uncharacterized Zn finger protein
MSRWFESRARLSVEGGVAVPKPGKVTDPQAQEMVEAAGMETNPRILARGRTYARAGQVIDVQSEPGSFTARIQGSDPEPYLVRLDRITVSGSDRVAADCNCPYGCDYDWCKHAAALAYVAAYLIDNDAVVRARWSGEEVESEPDVEPLTEQEVAALRSPPRRADPQELLVRAEAVVPYPHR